MKRRTLDILFSIGGLGIAALLFMAGIVLQSNANFANNYVHDQLVQQQITFKSLDTLTDAGFNWSLTGPDGKLVDGRGFQASDSNDKAGADGVLANPADNNRVVYELRPGAYTLTIDAAGDDVGEGVRVSGGYS